MRDLNKSATVLRTATGRKHTFIPHHISCRVKLIKRLDEVIVMMWRKICTRRERKDELEEEGSRGVWE